MPDTPRMREFRDRADAGRRLAERLGAQVDGSAVVLGLSTSGVPVAAALADVLNRPLEVLVVGKLGVPFQPRVGMGAVGEGGVRVLDEVLAARVGVTRHEADAVEHLARAVVESRALRYRDGRPAPDLSGRTAVIVDDQITSGATAAVACTVARRLGAARVVLAAAVGTSSGIARIAGADEIVCLAELDPRRAVASYFDEFRPTSDHDVVHLLAAARRRETTDAAP